jgi:hypothetical protein
MATRRRGDDTSQDTSQDIQSRKSLKLTSMTKDQYQAICGKTLTELRHRQGEQIGILEFLCVCVCICVFIYFLLFSCHTNLVDADIVCKHVKCKKKPVRGCQHGVFCEEHLESHRVWMKGRAISETESDILSDVFTMMTEKARAAQKGRVRSLFSIFLFILCFTFVIIVVIFFFFFCNQRHHENTTITLSVTNDG